MEILVYLSIFSMIFLIAAFRTEQNSSRRWQPRSVNHGERVCWACASLPEQVWVQTESKSHGELWGTLFRFHNVPVSSRHCKRAQWDLSTSVRKCTQKRSQCLTHFGKEIGELHTFAPLTSNHFSEGLYAHTEHILTLLLFNQLLQLATMGSNVLFLFGVSGNTRIVLASLPSNLF